MVLALAAYQVVLAAIGYGKLRLMDARPAFFTHRASGDAIVVIVTLVGLACVAAYGVEDDAAVHTGAGVALAVVFVLKIVAVRRGGRFLPVLGPALFVLLALTWLTAVPHFLSGED